MTFARGSWSGVLQTDLDGDGEPESGRWSWSIVATDAFGNTATASGQTDIVPTFC